MAQAVFNSNLGSCPVFRVRSAGSAGQQGNQGMVSCFRPFRSMAHAEADGNTGNGGLMMLGKHCIKAWCSTQGALALSSAEAEYYSLVEGVLRARGLQNIGEEIGMDGTKESVKLKVMIDSSAAKAFV